MVWKVKQVDSVNSLLHGNNKVDHAEVVLEPVPYEDATAVHEEPEFLIGGLEGGEVLRRKVCVKVARFDPRELGQVIHHLGIPGQYLSFESWRG